MEERPCGGTPPVLELLKFGSPPTLRSKGPVWAWTLGERPRLAAVVSSNKASRRWENGQATGGGAGGAGRKSLGDAWGPPQTPNRAHVAKKGGRTQVLVSRWM